MDSIRIKNLRSLVDTGDIEIKPLNIILGSNSSGKSSFLRFFPLLKQTINRKIRGVLFWSGYDQNDVDFGDFETALNNQEGHDKMEFSFSFNITKRELLRFSRPYKLETQNYWSKTPQSLKTTISICLEKNNADGLETISRVTIPIFGEDITINVSNKKINIGNRKYRLLASDNGYLYRLDSIFHLNNLLDSEEIIKKELGIIIKEINSDDLPTYIEYQNILKKDLIKLFKVNQDNEEYEIIKVKKLSKNELIIYKDMLLINFLETILKISDNYITSYFNKSVYIAPIRATAERYYRLRNLSIEEVDSSGRNLVDFLYNLDNIKFQQFQEWTNEFLGFQVEKDVIGYDGINKGYVSIYIRKNGDQNRYNLSDTGFGYSQILPIVTQLWFIAYNARKKPYFLNSPPTTIIIEQPELHLHPKLQSKLISAICSLANRNFRFIIETHSETIINKIGDLIYKRKINNEDVNLKIFSKRNNELETIVESSTYDAEGFLENWPIGFFDEEDYL